MRRFSKKPSDCQIINLAACKQIKNGNTCLGFSASEDDDEPCECCKQCRYCESGYEVIGE